MTTQETYHKVVAQTLRYAGYKAKAIKNEDMPHQPWEVKVSNISVEEQKELIVSFVQMTNNPLLNIVKL
jgi:signal recognition particle subunit SEC65